MCDQKPGAACCLICGLCLGVWATVMMWIAIFADRLWLIDHIDEHNEELSWTSDVSIYCRHDHLSVIVWGFGSDYAVDYDSCHGGVALNGDEIADCKVMGHVGRAWLAFCILSIISGSVGFVAPLAELCDISNRGATPIGGASLFTAGVMAFLAVAWLNVGGDENFCAKHGSLNKSPIFALIFGFVFWVAAGIMLAVAHVQSENKTKTLQIPVPIAVPE